ncbi:MAG: ribulose-phosphate 3-epimerase [Dehalococcoidia bacterium]|nr:ribulose-phosphate 3-epimerase [Dehalococcoidia bacterium]
MKSIVKIAPSILTMDYLQIEKEIKSVENPELACWHLDIMDGNFVPQISFGQDIVEKIKSISNIPIEVHLMVVNPHEQVQKFIDIGVDKIIVHIEAIADPSELISITHKNNKEFALAINPETSVEAITKYIGELNQVTVMTVHPGFGGQKMITNSLEKIKEIKDFMRKKKIEIPINFQVDGGVKEDNLELCISAGASNVVMGSAIFNDDLDRQNTVHYLQEKIRGICEN